MNVLCNEGVRDEGVCDEGVGNECGPLWMWSVINVVR